MKAYIPLIVATCLLLSAGCTVGPDYVRPTAVATMPAAFKELDGWKVAEPKDSALHERWWELFNDPTLNSLAEQVKISNLTVAVAEAQFRQARAQLQGAKAGYFPTVSVGASAARSQRSGSLGAGSTGGATSSDFLLPLDVTWELDLWGKVRRDVEAREADSQAAAANLAAVTLSSQAELALDYFLLRTVDSQKQLLEATTTVYTKALELTTNRYAAGVAAKSDLLLAQSQLKSTQAQALDLGVQRAQLEHAIALLMGKPTAEFSLPSLPLTLTAPPPPVPVGLPSVLLERRPDIAGAERRVAAANAQIGVAEAAWYPTVRLSASGGFEATSVSRWLSWPSRFWAVGPAVAESVFDGGLRRAQDEQLKGAYDATVATYRQTVLTGFREVEDNLAALRILEEESLVQNEAVKAAADSVTIVRNQYKAGTVSYLSVIVLQASELANERSAIDILGRRMSATLLLIKALGGGWAPPP